MSIFNSGNNFIETSGCSFPMSNILASRANQPRLYLFLIARTFPITQLLTYLISFLVLILLSNGERQIDPFLTSLDKLAS